MSKRDFNAISISSDSDDERPDGKVFKNEIDVNDQPSTSFNTDAPDGKQKSLPELLKVKLIQECLANIFIQIDLINVSGKCGAQRSNKGGKEEI